MFDSLEMSDIITIVTVFGVLIAFFLFIYIATSIFINKYHKAIFNKGSILAWIPVAKYYLLTKLNINKLFGYIYLVISFLLLFSGGAYIGIISMIKIGLIIYGFIRYAKIRRGELSVSFLASEINSTDFPSFHKIENGAVKRCINCGTEINRGDLYCSNCGNQVQ